jgi:hypothetical protein
LQVDNEVTTPKAKGELTLANAVATATETQATLLSREILLPSPVTSTANPFNKNSTFSILHIKGSDLNQPNQNRTVQPTGRLHSCKIAHNNISKRVNIFITYFHNIT